MSVRKLHTVLIALLLAASLILVSAPTMVATQGAVANQPPNAVIVVDSCDPANDTYVAPNLTDHDGDGNVCLAFNGSDSSDPDAGATHAQCLWAGGNVEEDPNREIKNYRWELDGELQYSGEFAEANNTPFDADGSPHNLRLVVTDWCDADGEAVTTLTFQQNPAPAVSDITVACNGRNCSFSATAADPTDPNPQLTYLWKFGDDATDENASARHVYDSDRTYNASLTVTDRGHATTTKHFTVDAKRVAPVADFTADCGERACLFHATATDPDGGVVSSYAWHFDDVNATGTGPATDHTYPADGAYDVALTVTDDENTTTTVTKEVIVPGVLVARFTPTCDDATLTCEFNASDAFSPDGSIESYNWDFGDGATNATNASMVTHSYPADGHYTTTLVVTDGEGNMSAPAQEIVTMDLPPVANFTTECAGLVCTFNASASKDVGGGPLTYAWEFGDGAVSTDGPVVQHNYSAASNFTVRLNVTDGEGSHDTTSVNLTVERLGLPTARATAVCFGNVCKFNASASPNATAYHWDFGDDNRTTTTGATVVHTYATDGTYSASLTVTNAAGSDGPLVLAVNVNATIFQDAFSGDTNDWELDGLWRVTQQCNAHAGDAPYLAFNRLRGLRVFGQEFSLNDWPDMDDGGRVSTCTYEDGESGATGEAVRNVTTVGLPTVVVDFLHRGDMQTKDPGALGDDDAAWARVISDHSVWTTEWNHTTPLPGAWSNAQVVASKAALTDRHENIGVVFGFAANGQDDDHGGWFVDDVRVRNVNLLPAAAPRAVNATVHDGDGNGVASVRLDGSGSTDPDGVVAAFSWLNASGIPVGVGANATVSLPVGSHELTLRVVDDLGGMATGKVHVTVRANKAPVADAGPDQEMGDADGDGYATVLLSGVNSTDADGHVANYEWIHENGTTLATGANVSVSLPVGVHSVSLNVTDNGNASATDSVAITVRPNQAPSAVIVAPSAVHDVNGDGNETVRLDGSESADPDGDIIHYTWLFNASGEAVNGSVAWVTLSTGTHNVTLQVRDSANATGLTSTVVKVNVQPTADAGENTTAGDPDADGIAAIRLNGTASHDSDGTVANYTWYHSGALVGVGATPMVRLPVGVNNVTLNVTDDDGGWGGDVVQVTVLPNEAPVARITVECAGYTCDFNASASSDPDGHVAGFMWNFGNGPVEGPATMRHTFNESGDYTVAVTVLDNGNGTGTARAVATAAAVFEDGFERTTLGNWTVGSAPDATNLWRVSTECVAPPEGATVLAFSREDACDYDTGARAQGWVASPVVNASGLSVATLSFKHFWETESYFEPYDTMTVQASNDGGESWSTLATWDSTDPNPGGWVDVSLDVSGHVGDQFQVRFLFDSLDDKRNAHQGWFVDAVRLS